MTALCFEWHRQSSDRVVLIQLETHRRRDETLKWPEEENAAFQMLRSHEWPYGLLCANWPVSSKWLTDLVAEFKKKKEWMFQFSSLAASYIMCIQHTDTHNTDTMAALALSGMQQGGGGDYIYYCFPTQYGPPPVLCLHSQDPDIPFWTSNWERRGRGFLFFLLFFFYRICNGIIFLWL